MRSKKRSPLGRLLIAAFVSLALAFAGIGASAYQTENLLVYVDAGNTNSYSSGTPGVWNDLSGNSQTGTIINSGGVSLSGGALNFTNGSPNVYTSNNGNTSYVDFPDGFANFGTGITIEVEAQLGTNVGNWERIFDFGNGSANNNFWLGRYSGTNDLAVEVWQGTTNRGRCKTATAVNAVPSGHALKKFTLTLDGALCRIYIDGTEVDTEVDQGNGVFSNNGGTLSSSYAYVPNNITRTNNFIGKSNWGSDAAFEGTVKYLRIYNSALSSQSVQNNATTNTPSKTITYSTSGSDSGSAPAAYVGDGAVTLSSNTGSLAKSGYQFAGWATSANQTTAISNSYTLSANVTLYPVFQPIVIVPGTPGTPTATVSRTTASLTWAAPTTGTAPFTYSVTRSPSGGTCTVTNLTASCTGLTAGTSYTFSVTAHNSAGSSSASSASNSVLATEPPQQSSPAPPPSPTLQVISTIGVGGNAIPKPINVTPGKSQTLVGTRLDLVSGVRVGNLTTSINQNLGSTLNIQIPRSLPAGRYKVELVGAFGVISQENFLEVPKKAVARIAAGFPADSPRISSAIQSKVIAAVNSMDGAVRAVCTGSTSGTRTTEIAKKLAEARAKVSCSYISRLYPSIATSIRIDPASGIGPRARNTTVEVFNY